MKSTHVLIFGLSCAIYVLGLLLYKSQKDLDDARLQRFARKEGLVTNFAAHHLQLQKLIKESERELRLAQILAKPRKTKFEPWVLIAETARFFNPKLNQRKAEKLAKLIQEKAVKYKLDPLLFAALISQESAFRARARSPVGAYGYGQLMPATAKFLGVNRRKPEENLEGAAKYLSQQMRTWRDSSDPVGLALASYNAGPTAVRHYGRIPPYRETKHYVRVVKSRYQTLSESAKAHSN